MKRRSFLQFLGLAPAAPVVVALPKVEEVVQTAVETEPEELYGFIGFVASCATLGGEVNVAPWSTTVRWHTPEASGFVESTVEECLGRD